MKKDIEQLINCIKTASTHSSEALGVDIREYGYLQHPESAWHQCAQRLMTVDTGLTVGNIFRIAECDNIFPSTIVLGIAGSIHTGNLLLYIDRVRLNLEKTYVQHHPFDHVKAISIATHRIPKTNCAIAKVFRQYIDVVQQIQTHSKPVELEDTLLSHLFEYVLHGGTVRPTIPSYWKT